MSNPVVNFRSTDQDARVIEHLRRHTGITSISQLVRLALRDLARKHGWKPVPAAPILLDDQTRDAS
jgi:hypothetical protein